MRLKFWASREERAAAQETDRDHVESPHQVQPLPDPNFFAADTLILDEPFEFPMPENRSDGSESN